MRSSFIVKPLFAIIKSVGSRRSRNPDALQPHAFERKLIIPLGAIPDKEFNSVLFFIVQPSESLNFKISLMVNKYLCSLLCNAGLGSV